jgi:hypothetical protein
LERGLETLIHVFSVVFYYTKNLELTFYHTQKAYYFYIEFIEQISDDNITFLQLSSKDAILFVYKKTIYDLNNEYKKNLMEPNEDEKIILNTLSSYIHFYKSVIINTLYSNKTNIINKNILTWKVTDSQTDIKNYNLLVNGEWHPLEYDLKTNRLIYVRNQTHRMKNSIEILVSDNCGNITSWKKEFCFQ